MALKFINKQVTGASGQIDIDWPGGPGSLALQGAFFGAVFQLKYTLDGYTTRSNMPGAEVTIIEDDVALFEIGPCQLRLEWSGGNMGGTTAVRVRLTPSWPGWFIEPTDLPATT